MNYQCNASFKILLYTANQIPLYDCVAFELAHSELGAALPIPPQIVGDPWASPTVQSTAPHKRPSIKWGAQAYRRGQQTELLATRYGVQPPTGTNHTRSIHQSTLAELRLCSTLCGYLYTR